MRKLLVISSLLALVGCSDDGETSSATDGVSESSGSGESTDGDGDPGDGDGDPGDGDGDPGDGDGDPGDGDGDPGEGVSCAVPSSFDPSGTNEWVDGAEVATVTVNAPDSCVRSYSLSTTAPLRDGVPDNPRSIPELVSRPRMRSGHDLFDALYALALEEVGECSVAMITDGAFNLGGAVPCGAEGCFETGRLWHYVWTRDTAYAMDLGLADLDPLRARNSLAFKLSERRGGGDLQVVQDTGSGGSYPVSSDRATWALGAQATLAALHGQARAEFAADAYAALRNTTQHDRRVVFDAQDGLYRGEQSFLDWREQSYAGWTADDVVHIAQSKSLNTNLAHLAALELVAELAIEEGDAQVQAQYEGWALELRTAIQDRLWLADEGQFSSHTSTGLDPAATRRFEALGASLAILLDVADPGQAAQILSGYPHYGPGVPVLWPQQQFTPIYHNRGEWPFVTAYWLRAAAHARHDAVATKMIRALIRGAALNLSNMENFEAGSGANWVDEGPSSGPVVNSQRQLWSVAAYVSMVHQVLFGLELRPAGVRVRPFIPAEIRAQVFGGTNALILNDLPYRDGRITVSLNLPDQAGVGALEVVELRVDGQLVAGDEIDAGLLVDGAQIEVDLGPGVGAPTSLSTRSSADYRDVFGPRTPSITSVADLGGQVQLSFDLAGEAPEELSLRIYRDGALVQDGLPGAAGTWTDADTDTSGPLSHCYSVEASYSSNNHSQHSAPACWWGPGAANITTIAAADLSNVGGVGSNDHGQFHYQGWGGAGDSLTAPSFTPSRSGRHLLQVEFGNGAGSINTGITCAHKRVTVERVSDDASVGEGLLIMPHLGTWDRWEDSNLVPVTLQAGVEYRIVIDGDADTVNMSAFDHFEIYTGGTGGVGGEFNDVNIAALRVFSLE